jgi:hypothetical protein
LESCLWQARQDSNLQPTVLETATLPIELLALGQLPLFAMRALAPAPAAIFAELQPFGGLHLIFESVIVAPLALSARQRDHHTVLFFCHRLHPRR